MIITKMDVKGAKLTIKSSINPKEIAAAQKVIKQYKAQQEQIHAAKQNKKGETK